MSMVPTVFAVFLSTLHSQILQQEKSAPFLTVEVKGTQLTCFLLLFALITLTPKNKTLLEEYDCMCQTVQ